MWVSHLEVVNFRSYDAAEIDLPRGPSVLVGRNGQGKTNLVEAVGYVSTLSSHRVAQDGALIAQGSDQAIVRVKSQSEVERSVSVELQINRGKSNLARLNRNQLPRPRDVLGSVRSVIFAPEDMRLVRGDPSDRRRFLDEIMVQVAPRYLGLRSEYDRVLKQRNALLRSLRGSGVRDGGDSLAIWDEPLINIGSELLWGRLNATRRLAGPVERSYDEISGSGAKATIHYRTALADASDLSSAADVQRMMRNSLETRRSEEIARAVTLVGPHRDDLVLALGGTPAKGFASHGESWSICLALRLASYEVMRELTGDPPVLILDDVFAELDSGRRESLSQAISGADQVLVTAAVGEDVPKGLGGMHFLVTRPDHSRIAELPNGIGSQTD